MLREITASWPSALLSACLSSGRKVVEPSCAPYHSRMSWKTETSKDPLSKERPWGFSQYWDGILFTFQSPHPNICSPVPALRALAVNICWTHSHFLFILFSSHWQFLFIDFNMNMLPKILATMSWKFKCLPDFKCRNLPVCVSPWTFMHLCLPPRQSSTLFPNKQF